MKKSYFSLVVVLVTCSAFSQKTIEIVNKLGHNTNETLKGILTEQMK